MNKYRFQLRDHKENLITQLEVEIPQGLAMELHETLSRTWIVEVHRIREEIRVLKW